MSRGRGGTPLGRIPAGGAFCALLLLFPGGRAAAQTTLAGTQIRNWATADFVTADGRQHSALSDTILVTVGQIAGVDIEPPRRTFGRALSTVVLPHTLRNLGNGPDAFAITAQSRAGWAVRVYDDVNRDGVLDQNDVQVVRPLALPQGGDRFLLLAIDLPAGAWATRTADTVHVRAVSEYDRSVADALDDVIESYDGTVSLSLTKSVDRASAAVGDVLTYSIAFAVTGSGTARGVEIIDVLPAGTRFVPGTIRLDGVPVDASIGFFDAAAGRVVVRLGDLAAGSTGTVSFQVVPGPATADRSVDNTARLTFGTAADTTVSNTVTTTIATARLELHKNVDGARVARSGEPLAFAISYRNPSPVTVRDVAIVDTLHADLEFVSATPLPVIEGRVLRWVMDSLPAGAAGDIRLDVRAGALVRDSTIVRNRAVLSSANAGTLVAEAENVLLLGPETAALTLTKEALDLEVELGGTAAYQLEIRNAGTSPLTELRVHNRLPSAGRYVPGSATGADSVSISGRDLVFFATGPLAPGASLTLRYAMAVVSAEGTTVVNAAFAMARRGDVRSAEVEAVVRVRSGFAVETRALIGRVWADLDGDGRQGPGEPGVEGVDVWTEDGEVVTTDADGRFSLRNLRPGRRALRIDGATLPASYETVRRGAGAETQVLDLGGWTTPRASFRVLPRAGVPVDIRIYDPTAPEVRSAMLPVSWQDGDGHAAASLASVTDPGAGRSLGPGATADFVLAPPVPGWPGHAVHVLPEAWSYVPGTTRISGVRAADPEVRYDRSGEPFLLWAVDEPQARVAFALLFEPAVAAPVEPVRVTGLRAGTGSPAFLTGPKVTLFAPDDGRVFATDRLYVGVRGEPGAPVALFAGDSLLARAELRVDGVHDFIAVHLNRGPHRLRVRMRNSWGRETWDSIAVHVSGLPARFEAAGDPLRLVADGHATLSFRARVFDAWGVPVTTGSLITVAAEGATPIGTDANRSSVGHQVRADSSGWFEVRLRAGHQTRRGKLVLRSGDATLELPLDLVPAAQPLLINGTGRVGAGAAPDAFGAVTARARLGERTSLIASYDSRQLDADNPAFGRVTDPLAAAQYPILGDASEQRSRTPSRSRFSARIERDFDWLGVGDVLTRDFSDGLTLARYDRALTGGAGRVTAGPLVLRGFGSATTTAVRQLQLRGAGMSGPYLLSGNIEPGTERVVIETRALENAQRTIAQQNLVRFVDYQIDYVAGTLLFKRPVPATDISGNPLFIVVTYEADGGGPSQAVWGGRLETDARRLLGGGLDSVRVGSTWIHDGADRRDIVSADIRLRGFRNLEVGAEIALAQDPDSAGVATALDARISVVPGTLDLNVRWLKVGAEFTNPANLALLPASEEIRAGASLVVGASKLRLEHEHLRHDRFGVSRGRTFMALSQRFTTSLDMDAVVALDQYAASTATEEAGAGELTVRWQPLPALTLIGESRYQFHYEGTASRPDHIGVGALLRLRPELQLEARHRHARLRDSSSYALTTLGLRSALGFGTEAWTSYEIASAGAAHNAAIVGLNNRIRLGRDWTVNAMFERRAGVGSAMIGDPVRAFPFSQPEEDYWSVGGGLELLPDSGAYRLSARGEFRDGDLRSTRLLTLAGDLSVNRSLGLLARQELIQTSETSGALSRGGRQLSSLAGIALRPTSGDALNVLAKFEWLSSSNPPGGRVLVGAGDESRVIGAVEAIWAPARPVEIATRYAVRRTLTTAVNAPDRRAVTDFIGWRGTVDVVAGLAVRADGRLLLERTTGTNRWDLAPQLVWSVAGLEFASGYRAGDLNDPDFAVRGGRGWFGTVGVAVSEQSVRSVTGFWRNRLR